MKILFRKGWTIPQRLALIAVFVAVLFGAFLIGTTVLWLVWNWIAGIVGLPALDWWQAFGVYVVMALFGIGTKK